MGKVTIILIVILGLAVAGGFVFLATWDIPAPSGHVEKVLPDARFPK
jgi:Flp pilus assembly protein CpaB